MVELIAKLSPPPKDSESGYEGVSRLVRATDWTVLDLGVIEEDGTVVPVIAMQRHMGSPPIVASGDDALALAFSAIAERGMAKEWETVQEEWKAHGVASIPDPDPPMRDAYEFTDAERQAIGSNPLLELAAVVLENPSEHPETTVLIARTVLESIDG